MGRYLVVSSWLDLLIEDSYLLSKVKSLSLHWEVPIFAGVVYVLWVVQNNQRITSEEKRMKGCRISNNAVSSNSNSKVSNSKVGSSKSKSISNRSKSISTNSISTNSTSPNSISTNSISTNSSRRSGLYRSWAFSHNLFMSVFSLVVFLHTFPVIWRGFWNRSFHDFVLDADKQLWGELANWIWVFYISKYYEIVDTAIIFAGGKKCTFLQMYHHAGAIVACWLISLSESYSAWIWVVLNSFIHSLMYLYYAATVVGIRPPFKRVITCLQIGQFLTGFGFGFIYIFYPGTFSKDYPLRLYQHSAIGFNIVYVAILTALFIRFERETYKSRMKAGASAILAKSSQAKLSQVKSSQLSELESALTSPASVSNSSAVLSPV
ncbi:hypothetical protein NEHOM01_1732 [Nematocida homosporus]|uniref:uncharacterized protein n=1 Tax=Nematocida homosporus TaxID=1912981 RepID=UPI002220AA3B|nr:uncharacterized protein NEHOM01_1732 [Nematocida homosporus]KAI5186831.1 hypothetical protein NEHOM01_1732 [Nematocida homosporus]